MPKTKKTTTKKVETKQQQWIITKAIEKQYKEALEKSWETIASINTYWIVLIVNDIVLAPNTKAVLVEKDWKFAVATNWDKIKECKVIWVVDITGPNKVV